MLLALAAALAAATPPACDAAAIALTVEAGGGDFNGMSHSGAWLRLTNRGRRACTLPALPAVMLWDKAGRPLPVLRQPTVGMHPGPVMRPVRIAPGETVRTGLRWVSAPVFEWSRCYDLRRATVAVGAGSVTQALTGHVCGAAGKPARFEQSPLAPAQP